MSLAGTTGAITGIVGLGVTLGALGLAFNLVDRQTRQTQETIRGGRKSRRRERDLFDFSNGGGRRKSSRRSDDIFDLGLTQRPAKRGRKFRSDFGDDFNIFAV